PPPTPPPPVFGRQGGGARPPPPPKVRGPVLPAFPTSGLLFANVPLTAPLKVTGAPPGAPPLFVVSMVGATKAARRSGPWKKIPLPEVTAPPPLMTVEPK